MGQSTPFHLWFDGRDHTIIWSWEGVMREDDHTRRGRRYRFGDALLVRHVLPVPESPAPHDRFESGPTNRPPRSKGLGTVWRPHPSDCRPKLVFELRLAGRSPVRHLAGREQGQPLMVQSVKSDFVARCDHFVKEPGVLPNL